MFLLNILLMLVWVVLTGYYSFGSLVLGFVVSYLLLWLLSRAVGESSYFRRSRQLVYLGFYFVYELVVSNIRVAWDVLTPRHRMRPGVVRVPLDLTDDGQVTLLANLITLTPGTLTLDISEDGKTLFMHDMYIGQRDEAVRRIKQGFERRIREVGGP